MFTTITPGSRWVSRASGFEVVVTSVSAGGSTVRYEWIEQHPNAAAITGWLFHGQFLDTFEPVAA
jgi:hypothetical protein